MTIDQTIAQFVGRRVLVIGDVSLDEYLFGQPTRLSREAPVPVLEWTRREIILGGAANPAYNIVALGGQATLIALVGNDPEGDQFRAALTKAQISVAGLLSFAQRPTTIKTRILAHTPPRLPQHLARLDRLDYRPLAPPEEEQLLALLTTLIPQHEAVLCSDYQLGMLTPTIVKAIRTLCQQYHVLLTVDAQGNADYYYGVDLFRCNDQEAARTLGRPLQSETDFQQGLQQLQTQLAAKLIIVTRGPEGVSLVGQGVPYSHLKAVDVSEVYDTTGAGDTFIAVATLALMARLEPLKAAELANVAAALVVRKLGNATLSPAQLGQAMRRAKKGSLRSI